MSKTAYDQLVWGSHHSWRNPARLRCPAGRSLRAPYSTFLLPELLQCQEGAYCQMRLASGLGIIRSIGYGTLWSRRRAITIKHRNAAFIVLGRDSVQ